MDAQERPAESNQVRGDRRLPLVPRWPDRCRKLALDAAFVFGLLHGFGFAGALAEVGLPQQAIPLALLFFNIGVELGQLVFVAAVLGLGWLLRRLGPIPIRQGQVAASYLIGGLAALWTIERVTGFWG